MSAKRRTTALARGVARYAPMASASAGLELPATSLIAPLFLVIQPLDAVSRGAGAPTNPTRRGGDNKAPGSRQHAVGKGFDATVRTGEKAGSAMRVGQRQRSREPGRVGPLRLAP